MASRLMATSSSGDRGPAPPPSALRGLLARGWKARDQVLAGSAAFPASAAFPWQNELHKDTPSASVCGGAPMRQSGSTAPPQLTALFQRFPVNRYAVVRAWAPPWKRAEAAQQQQQTVVATDLAAKRQVLLTCFGKGTVTKWQLEHAVRVMTTLDRHPRGFQKLLRIWDAETNWVVVQELEPTWKSLRASGFADPALFSEGNLRRVVFQLAALVHFLHSHALSLAGELWQHDIMMVDGEVMLLLPMHSVVSGCTLVSATERTQAADVAAIGMLMCQLAMMPCSPTGKIDIRLVQGALEDQLEHLSAPCRDLLFECLTMKLSVQELLTRKWLRNVDFLSSAPRLEYTAVNGKMRALLYKSLLWKLAAFCMLEWLQRSRHSPVDKSTEEEEEAESTRQRSRVRTPGRRSYSTSRRLLIPSGTLRRGPVPVPVPGHSIRPQDGNELGLSASDKTWDDYHHSFILPLDRAEEETSVSKYCAVYDEFKYEFPSVFDPEGVHYDAFDFGEESTTEEGSEYFSLDSEERRLSLSALHESGSDRTLQKEIVRSLRHEERPWSHVDQANTTHRAESDQYWRTSTSAPLEGENGLFGPESDLSNDNVHFSAFGPAQIALCEWFRLDIWAYMKQQRETMLETALEQNEAECGQRVQPLQIPRGTLVTVSIEPSTHFKVKGEDCKSFRWRGDISCVSFELFRLHTQLGTQENDEEEDELCIAKIVAGTKVSLLYIRLHSGRNLNGGVAGSAKSSDTALLDTELEHVAPSLQEIPPQELELIRPIGHGAFGDAVLARWKSTKQDVVVKTLSHDVYGSSDAQAELRHEATVMHLLGKHPHIVELFGVSSTSSGSGDSSSASSISLVTEYLPNGSVHDVLDTTEASSPLSLFSRTIMARDAAHGLANIHQGHILHRDVAARNCLVDTQFRVKVCDFGLSRRIRGSFLFDDESHGFGPLKWMAPESILAPHLFSVHSDAYMFGVLLYEILSGQAPFPNLSTRDAAALILEGHHVPIPSGLPATHRQLMQQCFEMHPLHRPSMEQIYRSLDQWTVRDTKAQVSSF